MKQITDSYRKTGRLHHAYAVLGDREDVKKELFVFLEKDLKFPTKGNPDFWQGEFNVFKIGDSRALNDAHLNKPVKYDRKVFVIFADFITKDAQNSLLKIFEEPSAETTFFLVLPSAAGLISTLKSRMIIVRGENFLNPEVGPRGSRDKAGDAEEFLSAKVGKRLTMVAKIAKDIKDEKLTKNDAITFLKNIEKVIKESLKAKNAHNGRGGSLLAIEDIEKAISYANDESPSIKVILDHLAVTL
jgi:DNA polymerase III delta prime subunit